MKRLVAISVALCAAILLSLAVAAQQGPPPQGGQGRPPGGGMRTGIDPMAADDHTGFTQIFDGKTLKGWDGNPDYWRTENDSIIGETTAEKPLKLNTFIIYRGGQPGDFELKLEYRINSTNSGVQYRSIELPDVGKWVLKGYQADIDFANQYTGQLYEERGRGFLALRGQMTQLTPGKKQVIANLRGGDDLKAAIKTTDWNQLHIIARGNRLTHILNGHLMAEAIDDDPGGRAMGGLLGFQLHQGPPMKVEYRNIWLKNL
ncbi:MAG: DUF1080 domain-containing protein [Acidobacteria bacterium]|nr:DUF1080 domain-containing protein [Acidobacteriota bacterium]